MQSEFDRILFFENTCNTAEAAYAKNPLDAENLTRWGGALIELSQFQTVADSKRLMIQDAISKLLEALAVSPKKHDTLWCLGNAYMSHAFLMADQEDAKNYIEKATHYFEQAASQEPGNERYLKSLEVAAKAPELYMEMHRTGLGQQPLAAGPSTSEGMKETLLNPSAKLEVRTYGSRGRSSWRHSVNRPPTPDATEDQEKEPTLQEIINIKLIESGEKERLMELLRERLTECGWKDEMKSLCRAFIKKKGRHNVTVDDLVHVITPKGRASVPDSVKAELLQKIRTFLVSAAL